MMLDYLILDTLYNHWVNHFGKPEMEFSTLYNALEQILTEPVTLLSIRRELFSLKQHGMVTYTSLDDGSSGSVSITSNGISIIEAERSNHLKQDIKEVQHQPNQLMPEIAPNTPDNSSAPSTQADEEVQAKLQACPVSLKELVQQREDLARLLNRQDILSDIKLSLVAEEHFSHFIVIYGQPMVGKTELLFRLAKDLSSAYLTLRVTGQGFHAFQSLDEFVYDLAIQIYNRYRTWSANNPGQAAVEMPQRVDFRDGNGKTLFYKFWDLICQIKGFRNTILIIDELEHLFDYPEEAHPHILLFLEDLISNWDNGNFIIAGSEKIFNVDNEIFRMLIAKGKPVKIHHYADYVTINVLTSIEGYINFDERVIRYLSMLCNGHPRFLRFTFEELARQRRIFQKDRIESHDIEFMLDRVIESSRTCIEALLSRLSNEEYLVIWLLSREIRSEDPRLEITIDDLRVLASKYRTDTDAEGLVRALFDLEDREWIEWQDRRLGSFRFKLGIFPVWLHRRGAPYLTR